MPAKMWIEHRQLFAGQIPVTAATIDERVSQLEKIVATQSEMILKLVEMMNHLGDQTTTLQQKVETLGTAQAEQLDRLAAALQRLAGQFGNN
jgi:hypothetical protein